MGPGSVLRATEREGKGRGLSGAEDGWHFRLVGLAEVLTAHTGNPARSVREGRGWSAGRSWGGVWTWLRGAEWAGPQFGAGLGGVWTWLRSTEWAGLSLRACPGRGLDRSRISGLFLSLVFSHLTIN